MEQYGLSGFYSESFPLLQRYTVAYDQLLSATMPELKLHLESLGVYPDMYLHEWLLTLFVNCLPSSVVLALWDSIMVNGLWLLVPTAIAVLQTFEETLFEMGFDESL